MYHLGNKAYSDAICAISHRLVSMFHSHVSQDLKEYTLSEFSKPNSVIRVLVSTIAFTTMGIEIPDIRKVIHWGPTLSMLAFWQELGRAGRDGKPATAIWYAWGQVKSDKDTFTKLKSHDSCLRKTILNTFILPETNTSCLKDMECRQTCSVTCNTCSCAMCNCCSYCRSCCPCSKNCRQK